MGNKQHPTLSTPILPMPATINNPLTIPAPTASLRRSPRKQKSANQNAATCLGPTPELQSASSQQRSSPQKQVSARRAPLRSIQGKSGKNNALADAPQLSVPALQRKCLDPRTQDVVIIEDDSEDDLAALGNTLSSLAIRGTRREHEDSEKENTDTRGDGRKQQPTSTMSRITQAARKQTDRKTVSAATAAKKSTAAPKVPSNPYVLSEAHCDEDLVDGSGTDGEDEDTDLSGFIVDDDAEISFHDSADALSSEESEPEVKQPRRQVKQRVETVPRRKLVRGRKKQVLESDGSDGLGLSTALGGMKLGGRRLEEEKDAARRKTIEVIDLTSSPVSSQVDDSSTRDEQSSQEAVPALLDPFASFNTALQLQPSTKSAFQLLPSKGGALLASPTRQSIPEPAEARPTTPPATPPRSPSKLKSPTKLRSPSKNLSPVKQHKIHRQSTDAFWDHEVVNEWTETYSPKKAPLRSPRKNLLERFDLFADDGIDDDRSDEETTTTNSSQDPFNESSDSLPSPCDSPTKSRSPSKASAVKADLVRARDEKRARIAAKKQFDAEKHQMAIDVLMALDANITSSKISSLSRSTGGMQLVWSKTLRSTAGRANWKRTVTKPSGSPVKGGPTSATIESQAGVVVQHFASIELAEKIIDRPERLVNTLAHEFCHLANFMVSGIRDQPHGASFQQWGKKVTSWLKSSAAKKVAGWRQEWTMAEVTTKHSYVVETKYLWVCTGRPTEKMGLAARMLELEGEDGCGAEYGRHSKSIDVDKQRCGVCKGFLLQVRPAPRMASPRKSPVKGRLGTLREESGDGVRSLQKLFGSVDLSD